jgi:hypothetical protein
MNPTCRLEPLYNMYNLKLFYDELRSFSTFFALNFDKKVAVE